MTRILPAAIAIALVIAVPDLTAQAIDINTAGSTGAYHTTFCPKLQRLLKATGLDYNCRTSAGTSENIERVFVNPRQIGYGQLDVIALAAGDKRSSPFTILRNDDVKECVFAVTRSRAISSYGDIAGYAARLNFVLPPRGSGSAATFQFLQEIDPDGLGLARRPVYANSTDDAIIRALLSDDKIAFFVQFPDSTNERFKLIKRMGGQLVPVIDRNIVNQQVAGRNVYVAQATSVDNASWAAGGGKVTTACTPLVVFTGNADRVVGAQEQRRHRDLIQTVKAIRAGALIPSQGLFARIMARTRALSAQGREKFLQMSERARTKAKPFMEQAKKRALELGAEAARKARPRN